MATIQLKRFKDYGCPFIEPGTVCEFPKTRAYFKRYHSVIEASNRSTKSLDFLKSLKEFSLEEIRALMNTKTTEVCSNVRVRSMCVLS